MQRNSKFFFPAKKNLVGVKKSLWMQNAPQASLFRSKIGLRATRQSCGAKDTLEKGSELPQRCSQIHPRKILSNIWVPEHRIRYWADKNRYYTWSEPKGREGIKTFSKRKTFWRFSRRKQIQKPTASLDKTTFAKSTDWMQKKEPVRRASRKYLNSSLERAELVGNWMKFSTSNFLAYPLAVIYSEFFPSARMFKKKRIRGFEG